jgi:putative phosphoribosyl transferase
VARSGRPDLVAAWLPHVQEPTLLIVGAAEAELVQVNRAAMRALTCSKRLEIVPAVGPLGDEPAALDAAAHLAGSWFVHHLSTGAPP